MRLSPTLSLYIVRQFLSGILVALAGLMTIVVVMDLVELIRRASGKDYVSFAVIAEMALLKAPDMMIRILPFAVLIGSMVALTRMTRSSELVVMRSAGVSVWQFLLPGLTLAMLLGAFFVTVFNPISAVLLARFEQLEGRYITNRPSLLAVSGSGLWLRQMETQQPVVREHIFHALRVSQRDMTLQDVTVFAFGEDSAFLRRVDARRAELRNGYWFLEDVIFSRPGHPPEQGTDYRLETDLTLQQIQDSFASPETMSFWALPGFIALLEQAGFSGLRHRLHWHSMLSSPMLLCAMVLVGAVFSLRLPRRGGIVPLIVAGIVTGFGVYFLSKLVNAIGLSGDLPVIAAAWAMPIATVMMGTGLLLHLEDG